MKPINLLITFLFIQSLVSCKTESPEISDSPAGNWEMLGYGRVAAIDDAGDFQLFDKTKISCIPLIEANIEIYGDALRVVNDTMFLKDGINDYRFVRISALPELCSQEVDEARANDPEYNFEVLAATFKEQYAYFELREVNWQELYEKYRAKVTAESSDVELYMVMEDMLNEFNDGHIYLDVPGEVEEAADSIRAAKVQPSEDIEEKSTLKRYNNHQVAHLIADRYFEEKQSRAYKMVQWGMLPENVGYVQVNQMMGLIDYGIPDSLSRRDYFMTYFEKVEEDEDHTGNEVSAISSIMDEAMADLSSADVIILDARFNGGGQDEVGLEIMRRFNPEERLVFTKQARDGDGYTVKNPVVLKAHEKAYTKPVFLLTSHESASATEIMILSSLLLDHVYRVGSNSEGVFSDVLDKYLPNGWGFGLSNEVYLDTKGNNYEGTGIPAVVELGYTRDRQVFFNTLIDNLESGDPAIEKALELAKND